MLWEPPSAGPADLDPRLDGFRERAGRLLRGDGTVVATVYLQPQVWWTGHGWLWWKRWSDPTETVDAYVVDAHGELMADYFIWGEWLDEEVKLWSAGTFGYKDELLRVVWLDDEESRVIREWAGFEPVEI